ncbi:MAG: proton-conducting transporter membrane subunit [Ferruginibacter sp.]
MILLLPFFVIIPLIAFLASLFFSNKNEKGLATLVQLSTALYVLGAVAYCIFWLLNGIEPIFEKLAVLYKTQGFEFALQFFYDDVTAVYSIVGAFIFFFVARFSHFYMHRDAGFKRFFSTFLLFLLGYNIIVFSGNFETLFIGWEAIGISSFLLIAFYRERYLPVKNAFKVLSIYRVSDIGLILAMWMMHHLTHENISFTELHEPFLLPMELPHMGMAHFIALMFILASVAKSAQLPFITWLPRAMEGPTSSSAIFYGSLSVHIGVFILLRTHDFWNNMFWIKVLISVIGATTSFAAMFIARVQPTVKTQIAYASVAQIGLIFIEVAWGWHWLALLHFAGNAFLRTYQILVSPSVLNYLVHKQYFHHEDNISKGEKKLLNTFYALGIKEWNLDGLLHDYLWMPFKWMGRKLNFLEKTSWQILIGMITCAALSVAGFADEKNPYSNIISILFLVMALALILFSFASRKSPFIAWEYLFSAHVFIVSGLLLNAGVVELKPLLMYGTGVIVAFAAGIICLYRTYKINRDISLNYYHGYVYEDKKTAFVFLLAATGIIGYPITAAFVGIDIFYTYIGASQGFHIALTALCFLFLELAAIRIFIRVYYGLHKKLDHPVAFRSS